MNKEALIFIAFVIFGAAYLLQDIFQGHLLASLVDALFGR